MSRFGLHVRRFLSAVTCLAMSFAFLGVQPAFAAPTLAEATDNALSWSTGGSAAWTGVASASDSHDGIDCAISGSIGGNQTTYMETTVTGPGTLTWWYRTSTETSWDKLRVYDNGVLFRDDSGAGAWTFVSYDVSAGSHTIRWQYEKDFSINSNADTVYVDQVRYNNAPPVGRVDGAHLSGTEVELLAASPEASAQQGFAVGISGDTLVSGANRDDTTATDAGSVTVYKRSGDAWTPTQLLTAEDEVASAYYGSSVALDGDALAVGTPTREKVYTYYDFGAGFVKRGGPLLSPEPSIGFGAAIAQSGNTLVVGARAADGWAGRVYVYEYNAGWDIQEILTAPDGVANDAFGSDVEIDGDRIIVGAPYHDHAGAPGGAAYIFDRTGTDWTCAQEINDTGGLDGDKMGTSVAVSGNTAIAGDQTRNTVDVFTLDSTWTRTDVLTRPMLTPLTSYGVRVAMSGNTILVGDAFYDWSSKGGTVFAYTRANGVFFDLAETIQASVGQNSLGFGDAFDIEGPQFAIGARLRSGAVGSDQGATYVYGGAYYHVAAGGTLDVPATMGVLSNDTDENADILSVYSNTEPASGLLDLASNGGFAYVAEDPSATEMTFTYVPTDGDEPGESTNAYITVAPAPVGTPVFNGNAYYTGETSVDVIADFDNVRQYRIKVDSGAWSDWVTYTTSDLSATLPAVVGEHSVYLEVRGSGGNRSYSKQLYFAASVTYSRFSGSDRYITAILAAQAAYATGSCNSIIVATGLNYPDALAAAGLGGAANAPVLLVGGDVLRADIKTEMKRLTQGKATFKVYIMGSNAAVSAKMETSIKALLTGESVERFSGANRYATAQLVAAKVKSLQGAGFGNKAILITGADYVDGLLVGPAAFNAKAPILLIGTSADTGLVNTLKALGTTDLVILGTTARISASSEAYLTSKVPGLATRRVSANTNTYARSAEAAEYFANPANGFGLTWAGIGIATAEKFPDGLSAGCVEGKLGGTLLLTRVLSLPSEISPRLSAHKGVPAAVRFYGSPAAVSVAAETSVKNLLKF